MRAIPPRLSAWFKTLPLWLRLARHAKRFPQPAELRRSAILSVLSAIEQAPPSPHPRLARLVHRRLLAAIQFKPVIEPNLFNRATLWPFVLRINTACLRAGLHMPLEHIQTNDALMALLTCQASSHDQPLPDYPPADSRLLYFWNAVATDRALDQYWTAERCAAPLPSHCASHFEPLALSCLATARVSAELARALTRLHALSQIGYGPFSSLARFPLATTDRWLFHGWAPSLTPLARQLALISPDLLFDLLKLAYSAPDRFRHYCPVDPLDGDISLHDCLRTLCDANLLREHGEILLPFFANPVEDCPALLAAFERISLDMDIQPPTPTIKRASRL